MAVTTDRAAVQPRRRDQHARTTLEAAYAEHAPRLVRLAFLLAFARFAPGTGSPDRRRAGVRSLHGAGEAGGAQCVARRADHSDEARTARPVHARSRVRSAGAGADGGRMENSRRSAAGPGRPQALAEAVAGGFLGRLPTAGRGGEPRARWPHARRDRLAALLHAGARLLPSRTGGCRAGRVRLRPRQDIADVGVGGVVSRRLRDLRSG